MALGHGTIDTELTLPISRYEAIWLSYTLFFIFFEKVYLSLIQDKEELKAYLGYLSPLC